MGGNSPDEYKSGKFLTWDGNVGILAKESLIRKQIILMGGDTIAGVAILFMLQKTVPREMSAELFSQTWFFLFVPVLIFCSYFCDIYSTKTRLFKTIAIRSVVATAISFFILMLISRLSSALWPLFFGLISFIVVQISWRSVYRAITFSSFLEKNLIVIGTGTKALEIDHMLSTNPGKYSLSGYISTALDPVDVKEDKILGHIDDIVAICKKYRIHSIVMALTERRGNLAINKLVSCKLMGVRIIDYPNLYETMTGKIPVESINPSWLVQSSGFLITPFIRVMKRFFDILLSFTVLVITLPLFPVFIFLIKYKSPGPIFYTQKRVGENGNEFTIFKFRSMSIDAETKTGAAWAKENDPRISVFGHFLRKTRIDELPQLINVLKGDMSFIGPRPERLEFVEKICEVTPYYMERHAVKPGITGWAQVRYPYGASLGDSVEKLRYDLYYINNLSVFLELLIVFETIKVVIFRKGGR